MVYTDEKLQERVTFVHERIGTAAIVEQYIDGREIYVGVLGDGRLTVLPIWELKFTDMPADALPIATEHVKHNVDYQKRRGVQDRLYELRAFAHVIDMHQLTKDPTIVLSASKPTDSSPARRMSEFELSRYLDYCAEMLALIAKLAALYAAQIRDRDVMVAVTEVEELTSDLGRKIWQKIMILSDLDERRTERER